MRLAWLAIVAACGRTGFDPSTDAATGSADARTVDAPPPGNLVFTTSSTHNASFGGLAGADAICAQRATEAGLAGTYIAFLSTSTTNAIDRLDGSRGWQRVDGKPVIDLPSQLTDLRAWYPISLDESGNDVRVNATQVWTGTDVDGTADSDTCNDWQTSTGGFAGIVGSDESGAVNLMNTNFSDNCGALHRLYCFGTGVHPVSPPTPTVGRLAWLSDETWTPAGTSAADAICQSEGASVRAGTYLAALGATTSVESRFSLTGLPWVRADGVLLATTPSELFAGSFLLTHLAMSANGQPLPGRDTAFWGGEPATPLSSASTCNAWAGSAGTTTLGDGDYSTHDSLYFLDTMAQCTSTARLLCLEE